MQSHAAHTGELRCTEQQVASLKITEGNPAQDPSQNQMGRPVFRTIQATGCNFRVSKETTAFDVVFFLHSVSIMGLLPVTGSCGDADEPFDRYENCIQSL